MSFYDLNQCSLINRCKEFSYITLQNPTCSTIALRNLSYKLVKTIKRMVRSLKMATRV